MRCFLKDFHCWYLTPLLRSLTRSIDSLRSSMFAFRIIQIMWSQFTRCRVNEICIIRVVAVTSFWWDCSFLHGGGWPVPPTQASHINGTLVTREEPSPMSMSCVFFTELKPFVALSWQFAFDTQESGPGISPFLNGGRSSYHRVMLLPV